MEEKKLTRIPSVRATEVGRAQLVNLCCCTAPNCGLCVVTFDAFSLQSFLERFSDEGDTPVRALRRCLELLR